MIVTHRSLSLYLCSCRGGSKEMADHQKVIDDLEDSNEDVRGRENSAEQRLKRARKAHAKLQQAHAAADKV